MLIQLLERLYDWLSPSDQVCSGDLIFALAGRQSRKIFALELFHQGRAGSILLSLARFEIRKFAQLSWPADINLLQLAASTPPAQRHYFVSFEAGTSRADLIPRGRFGTLTEIKALARWLDSRPHIRSIVVVSSGPHLRRVRACCRTLLPAHLKVHFVPTPNDKSLAGRSWWRDPWSRKVVLKEIPKLLVYKLILWGTIVS